jgi:hypothetical protein
LEFFRAAGIQGGERPSHHHVLSFSFPALISQEPTHLQHMAPLGPTGNLCWIRMGSIVTSIILFSLPRHFPSWIHRRPFTFSLSHCIIIFSFPRVIQHDEHDDRATFQQQCAGLGRFCLMGKPRRMQHIIDRQVPKVQHETTVNS